MRIALVGGTGLIGALLAERLVAEGHELHRIQRRAAGRAGEEHVAPAERWGALTEQLAPEAAISTLGTTIRKAGSQAEFRRVDFGLVTEFARAAQRAGTRRMVSVSSVGADPGSRNFYLRTKGEMERLLAGLGFARLDLFRPGLLRGERAGDRRVGERIGLALSPAANLLLRGPLNRFAAIDAMIVADAIVAALALPPDGTHIHHNRAIRALAGR
ncbi:NAD-dependent epimerase/dehydratase family protein [Sphingomonas parva]|uniref:NAD-dependent epimerase/dehydratase family protein n=1 Tax=Sphingomonas parva TaxID=2555898 RepID=A0A4Y8ZPK4_9SPHN|nr:NAD-dependent epimerase/dehydratase family protein [Sphingomonas parva]TFI57950.1 NAD-dependent epimerase/dehydratase family protein [Sphingomonas parva]